MKLSYPERIPYCTTVLGKKLLTIMHEKKTNLSLSVDVTKAERLLDLADQIGPTICVLKTHIDIIEDFSPLMIQRLDKLAKQHRFLIFEDRKFADIGQTVSLQYQGGIYRIADWANIINAHSLPGISMVAALRKIGLAKQHGLLLLAQMSAENNLIDAEYTQKTLALAQQFPDFVMGFIAQQQFSKDPRWIYFTPGIKLQESTDGAGQNYITPKKAILENNTDVIIVGRGILQASVPLLAAQQYQEIGWQEYVSRLSQPLLTD